MVPTGSSGATSRRQISREQAWEDLAEALRHETKLLDHLRDALLQQRAGVANDDVAAIESSIQAMGRTLLTLGEARERRMMLTGYLAGGQPLPLAELERSLTESLPRAVQQARAGARRAATAVSREVTINHHVVSHALDAGEMFIQHLFSSVADPVPVYVSSHRAGADTPQNSMLLNKRI